VRGTTASPLGPTLTLALNLNLTPDLSLLRLLPINISTLTPRRQPAIPLAVDIPLSGGRSYLPWWSGAAGHAAQIASGPRHPVFGGNRHPGPVDGAGPV